MHNNLFPGGAAAVAAAGLVLAGAGCKSTASGPAAEAASAQTLPMVSGVELQPLSAQVKRVAEALDYLGAPLSSAERQALEAAMSKTDEALATAAMQSVLDRHC